MLQLGHDTRRFSETLFYSLSHKSPCRQLNESVSEIYRKLKQVNAISGYIEPCYDVLHTLGAEYLMEDLQEYAKLRGVTL